MDVTQLDHLATLRAVVGYLGEQEQHAWWQSSFFAPGSQAFLAPLFGRTQVLAQINGVTCAASVIHDEHIGVGNVYHLFRLPENIEQGIHHALHNPELCEQIAPLVVSKESAMAYLRNAADSIVREGVGPTHIGNTHDLRDPDHWSVASAHYIRAFNRGAEVYPYFADRT